MKLKVYECGQEAGNCLVKDDGLYWYLECECEQKSVEMMGLFGAGHYFGLLERNGNHYRLCRRLSKNSLPRFSTQTDKLLLLPRQQEKITICEIELTGYLQRQEGKQLFRISGCETQPHPCMPLFCFFQYTDGFWMICLDEKGSPA